MTQKEIARKLNVSQATVSFALKGSPRITPEMREAVLAVARESGYSPNLAGQLLRQGRCSVIGAVLPTLVNSFHAELFQELQRLLTPLGYLVYFAPARTQEEVRGTIANLRQMRVAGVVALGQFAEEFLPLKDDGTAVVFYGGDGRLELPCSQILPDRYQGGAKMARYLLGKGYRKFAFIGVRNKEEPRYCGFLDTLTAVGFSCFHVASNDLEDVRQGGYTAFKELWHDKPSFDALFAHNDEVAIGVLRAANELNIKVPDELAVAGFDHIREGEYSIPALTSVEQPRHEIAKALVAELQASLRDASHHNFISIPCNLIVRESA